MKISEQIAAFQQKRADITERRSVIMQRALGPGDRTQPDRG